MVSVLTAHVDPWLLAHGIIFMVNYSVLMPVASFVIMYNHDKYYLLHKVLGVVIIVLLVAGWGCLQGWVSNVENKVEFAPVDQSGIGRSHALTGTIARFVGMFVCIIGVVLAVARMPESVGPIVRYMHAIGGICLSFLGPLVVWNGFVRLQPFLPSIGFFNSTPIVWLSVAIAVITAYIYLVGVPWLKRKISAENPLLLDTKAVPKSDIETSVPTMSVPEIVERISSLDATDSLFFFFQDTFVQVDIRKDVGFEHPGGNDLLKEFSGKDITGILMGTDSFSDQGRMRFAPHSPQALKLMHQLRIGKIPAPASADSTTPEGTGSVDDSMMQKMFSIDEEETSPVTIISKRSCNDSASHPVYQYTLRLENPVLLLRTGAGSKVRLGLVSDPGLVRTFTVVSTNLTESTIEVYIKIYPEGAFTSELDKVLSDTPDVVEIVGVSDPPPFVGLSDRLGISVFIAAGTGIVPLVYYMERSVGLGVIVWSLRCTEDVFLIDQLRAICNNKSGRCLTLVVFFTGMQAATDVAGTLLDFAEVKSGRVGLEFIQELLPGSTDVNVVMSGPRPFISSMHSCMTTLGVQNILSLD